MTAYQWDALGQLVGLQTVAGDWRFDYDALGRRTLVEGPGGFVRTFAYDTNDLARVVYDGSGAVVASYVTGMGFGEVLAEERDGVVRYAVRDKLSTPAAWLDGLGGVAALVPRDAYGRRVGGSPSDVVPYGYTGHAEDPTGLVWGRARYLDTRTGGWLSEDPVWEEPRYGYVWGAPAMQADPSGKVAYASYVLLYKEASCQILAPVTGTVVQAGFLLGGIGRFSELVSQGYVVDATDSAIMFFVLSELYEAATTEVMETACGTDSPKKWSAVLALAAGAEMAGGSAIDGVFEWIKR